MSFRGSQVIPNPPVNHENQDQFTTFEDTLRPSLQKRRQFICESEAEDSENWSLPESPRFTSCLTDVSRKTDFSSNDSGEVYLTALCDQQSTGESFYHNCVNDGQEMSHEIPKIQSTGCQKNTWSEACAYEMLMKSLQIRKLPGERQTSADDLAEALNRRLCNVILKIPELSPSGKRKLSLPSKFDYSSLCNKDGHELKDNNKYGSFLGVNEVKKKFSLPDLFTVKFWASDDGDGANKLGSAPSIKRGWKMYRKRLARRASKANNLYGRRPLLMPDKEQVEADSWHYSTGEVPSIIIQSPTPRRGQVVAQVKVNNAQKGEWTDSNELHRSGEDLPGWRVPVMETSFLEINTTLESVRQPTPNKVLRFDSASTNAGSNTNNTPHKNMPDFLSTFLAEDTPTENRRAGALYSGDRLSDSAKICRSCILAFVYFITGMCVSVLASTLVDFNSTLRRQPSQVSQLLTSRGTGTLIGAVLVGLTFNHLSPYWTLTVALFITSASLYFIPMWNNYFAAMGCALAMGAGIGFLEAGCNLLLIRLWGRRNAPYMHGIHFAFGIGTVVAPMIVQTFQRSYHTPTGNQMVPTRPLNITNSNSETSYVFSNLFIPSNHSSRFFYGYFIVGGIAFLATIVMFLLWILGDKRRCLQRVEADDISSPYTTGRSSPRKSGTCCGDATFSRRYKVLIFFMGIFQFIHMGIEVSYKGLIGLYAVTIFGWTSYHGSWLVAVCFFAYTLGRGIAIFVSKKVRTTTLLGWHLTLMILSLGVELLLGWGYPISLWVSVAMQGLGQSAIMPSSLTWIESEAPLTAMSGGFLMVMSSLGSIAVPAVVGLLMGINRYLFTGIHIILTIANAAILILLAKVFVKIPEWTAPRRRGAQRRRRRSDELPNNDAIELRNLSIQRGDGVKFSFTTEPPQNDSMVNYVERKDLRGNRRTNTEDSVSSPPTRTQVTANDVNRLLIRTPYAMNGCTPLTVVAFTKQ